MGILSRISKILESNLNALVDRAEDPAKMLDQAIEDMKKGREEARQAIIEARTQKRLLENKLEKSLREAQELERKATVALVANDENLARKMLQLKSAIDQRAAAEQAAVTEQDTQITQLSQAERELEHRLIEMPAKRAALLARQAAAHAKGARSGAKGRDRVASALEAFDRMEEKVVRAEVEAEVASERAPKLLESSTLGDYSTDAALDALKAKVKGQLPSGAQEKKRPREESAEPDVEDTLREMKAKLRKQGEE